jgi:hypothetical protein
MRVNTVGGEASQSVQTTLIVCGYDTSAGWIIIEHYVR